MSPAHIPGRKKSPKPAKKANRVTQQPHGDKYGHLARLTLEKRQADAADAIKKPLLREDPKMGRSSKSAVQRAARAIKE